MKKYSRLNLVFPKSEHYPPYIDRGFPIFCQIHEFELSIIDRMEDAEIHRGEAYVIVSDDDLYAFIHKVQQRKWILSQDCGVVAYNENRVKEILCDGITTISTNHEEIGHMAAMMILTMKFKRVKCLFQFIRRNSL